MGDFLSIEKFMAMLNITVETFMFERYWCTLHGGMPILICDQMLWRMGYVQFEDFYKKGAFMKALHKASMKEGKDFYHYHRNEYQIFRKYRNTDERIYPSADPWLHYNNRYLLLTPACLRKVALYINTPQQPAIYDHIERIDALSRLYVRYIQGDSLRVSCPQTVETRLYPGVKRADIAISPKKNPPKRPRYIPVCEPLQLELDSPKSPATSVDGDLLSILPAEIAETIASCQLLLNQ